MKMGKTIKWILYLDLAAFAGYVLTVNHDSNHPNGTPISDNAALSVFFLFFVIVLSLLAFVLFLIYVFKSNEK